MEYGVTMEGNAVNIVPTFFKKGYVPHYISKNVTLHCSHNSILHGDLSLAECVSDTLKVVVVF